MCPDEILIYMGKGRQSHTKTSAAEQRVPTNWGQHSRGQSSSVDVYSVYDCHRDTQTDSISPAMLAAN